MATHLGAKGNKEGDGVVLHAVGGAPYTHPSRHDCPSSLEHRYLERGQSWAEALKVPGICHHTPVPTQILGCRDTCVHEAAELLTLLRVTGRYRVCGPWCFW